MLEHSRHFHIPENPRGPARRFPIGTFLAAVFVAVIGLGLVTITVTKGGELPPGGKFIPNFTVRYTNGDAEVIWNHQLAFDTRAECDTFIRTNKAFQMGVAGTILALSLGTREPKEFTDVTCAPFEPGFPVASMPDTPGRGTKPNPRRKPKVDAP